MPKKAQREPFRYFQTLKLSRQGWRAHGQIIYANDAAAHMTGFSSVQAMLKTLCTAIVTQFEIIDEQGHPFPLSQLPH